MQHDPEASFLSLLSSQRELLSQLNMENAIRRADLGLPAGYGPPPPYTTRPRAPDGPNFIAPAATNRGIDDYRLPDQRTNADSLLSKRLSLGLGMGLEQGGYYHMAQEHDFPYKEPFPRRKSKLDDFSSFNERHLSVSLLPGITLDTEDSAFLKRDKLDASEYSPSKRKKRRLSSLGFLNSSFFDDNLKESERRGSLSVSCLDIDPGPLVEKNEEDVTVEENVTQVIVDGDADSEDEGNGPVTEKPLVKSSGFEDAKRRKIDAAKMTDQIEKFTKMMELSQKTQQAIHDWDRKMGLKRSHSKTMRLSTRSRKKLRASMKKEMNAISKHNK